MTTFDSGNWLVPLDSNCLRDTALYLQASSANSVIRLETRRPKLGGWFRWASLLRLPTACLVLLTCLRQVWTPASFSRARGLLLEDHASAVIMGSLKRVYGEKLPRLERIRPRRLRILHEVARNTLLLSRVYQDVNPTTVFDRTRTLRLLANYLSCRALLQEHAFEAVFLARTNDQKRLALGVAAKERGLPVVAWTVERQGSRPPSPFPLSAQLCWSRAQARTLIHQGVAAYQMPVTRKPFRSLKAEMLRSGKLGFLLNARVDIPRLRDFLESLCDAYGIRNLQVRPHPGKQLQHYSCLQGSADIRDWKEPLANFLDSVDAVLAMTSGSIDEALWRGVPVMLVGGLDDVPAEYCGMVSGGILPLFRTDRDPTEDLVRHYADWQDRILYAVSEYSGDPQPERSALERFMPNHVC